MCFCAFFKQAYTYHHMKTYVPILIGIVVLGAALYGGNTFMKKGGSDLLNNKDTQSEISMKSVVGQVVRVYEGDHVLEYAFDIPETATTSIDMEGALIRVLDNNAPTATFYMSYEGARGYSALDYLSNKIAPHVSVINPTNIVSLGGYDWQMAESEGSEWYIASVASSSWLIVVENKKTNHDMATKIIESISVK